MTTTLTLHQHGDLHTVQLAIRPAARRRYGRQLTRLLENARGSITYHPGGVIVEGLERHVAIALLQALERLLAVSARRAFGGPLPNFVPAEEARLQIQRAPRARAGARRRREHCWAAMRAGAGRGIVPGPSAWNPWLGGHRCGGAA